MTGELDEVIVVLSSIASTCRFLLQCPVMSHSIASAILLELSKSLNDWKGKRKDGYFKTLEQADDDELVTHMFHAAFLIWICGKCWLSSSPSFGGCCGGLIKLGRGHVIESSFGAVARTLMGMHDERVDVSKALCAVPDADCEEFRSFASAVITRHEGGAPALGAVKLMFVLTMLSRGTPQFVPLETFKGFPAAVIELVAGDASPPVINAIATRAMSASQFYITDIEVLLSGLRLHMTRESDADKQEAVRKALRVVLRDTIPSGDASRHSDLCRWVEWLQLKADCSEAIEASGVTGDDLQGDFGRLDVVMRMGVDNAEDAEWVFQVLNS